MTLKELARLIAAGEAPIVEVHAVEHTIYVPYVRVDDQLIPFKAASGKTLRFPSRHASMRALKGEGLAAAQFVHKSAYDEMIGVASSTSNAEFRELVDLRSIGDY